MTAPEPGRRVVVCLAVVVALVAAVLYVPTWWFDFTHLDDDQLIVDQLALLRSPSTLVDAFGRTYFPDSLDAYYRPLVTLSFALNARCGGADPFGYHLVNGLLHAANAALAFALLLAVQRSVAPAFCAAILFAVHPAACASVAWIPGRNDLLLAGFSLAAGLLLLRAQARPGLVPAIGHLSCFALALISKETAVALPLVFVALYRLGPHGAPGIGRRALWLGWGAVVAAYAAARAIVVHVPPGYWSEALRTTWHGLPVLLADAGKLVCPLRLQVLAAPDDVHPTTGLIALLVAGLGLAWIRGLRCPVLLLSAVLTIVPLAATLPAARSVVLENRLYLPVLGVALLASEVMRALDREPGRMRGRSWWAAGVVTVLFSGATLLHQRHFRDLDAFSAAAVQASPHSGLAAHLRFKASYGKR